MQLMTSAIVFDNLFPFCSDDIWSAVTAPHSIHYINDQWRWGGEDGKLIPQQEKRLDCPNKLSFVREGDGGWGGVQNLATEDSINLAHTAFFCRVEQQR